MAHRLMLAALIAASGCVFDAPAIRGPVTDHFDGRRFMNPNGAQLGGVAEVLGWQLHRQQGPWRSQRDEQPGPRPPYRVGSGELRATFINHATVLLQLDGVNVLTDPIWAQRSSPVGFAGPRRVRPPGLRFEDLPPIDAVVISHNHYDHLNLETLERLQAAFPHLRIVTSLGNRALLERHHLHAVVELDWGQSLKLGPELTVTSVPTQHFSGRGLADGNRSLWCGFVFAGPSGRTYFAGDTGYGPHFKAVGEGWGPFRLAVLPIGSYLPRQLMSPIHLSPDEAVQAKADLGAAVALAVHFGTFPLADDGETQAPDELQRAAATDFWLLGFGEGRDVPAHLTDEATR